jgi:hypothetical protein
VGISLARRMGRIMDRVMVRYRLVVSVGHDHSRVGIHQPIGGGS